MAEYHLRWFGHIWKRPVRKKIKENRSVNRQWKIPLSLPNMKSFSAIDRGYKFNAACCPFSIFLIKTSFHSTITEYPSPLCSAKDFFFFLIYIFLFIHRYEYQRCYLARFQMALHLLLSINQMLTIELKMVDSGVNFRYRFWWEPFSSQLLTNEETSWRDICQHSYLFVPLWELFIIDLGLFSPPLGN